MPKITMPSKYLAKEDIHGDMVVTIKGCSEDTVGQGNDAENKWILHFHETPKGVVINATNLDTLIELFGSDESEDWEQQKVILYVDPDVRYAGKKVGGIRLKGLPKEKPAQKSAAEEAISTRMARRFDLPSNGAQARHWPVQDDCYGMLLEEVPSDHLDAFLAEFPNAALTVRRMAKAELDRRG